MIFGEKRDEVIYNIWEACRDEDWYAKVEVGDPQLTRSEKEALIVKDEARRKTVKYKICNRIARAIADEVTEIVNKDTEVIGLENLEQIRGGAIITSNHFSPVDSTIVRHAIKKIGHRRLYTVSRDENLAMEGMVGFLMKYADTLPISNERGFIEDKLVPTLRELMESKQFVLIYPEQEMWFNYRKPRPPKRGAYYCAARLNVPVISCFVEMRDTDELDGGGSFHKVRYIMHILPPIYPDPRKTARENSVEMCKKDFEQKRHAYESAYGKSYEAHFCKEDIAGWI